jgi:uncharacterized protein YbcV (DUF1398 family)
MAKKFVIKSTVLHTNTRTGKQVELVGYFLRHNVGVFEFNEMVTKIEEAKHYDFITEAHREKRKYFGSQKSVKVVPYEPQTKTES